MGWGMHGMADAAVLGWHEIMEGQTPGVEEYWIHSCLLVRRDNSRGYLNALLLICCSESPHHKIQSKRWCVELSNDGGCACNSQLLISRKRVGRLTPLDRSHWVLSISHGSMCQYSSAVSSQVHHLSPQGRPSRKKLIKNSQEKEREKENLHSLSCMADSSVHQSN